MAVIPTESRIFADRYCREARRLEALHAGRLSPGATTWRDALQTLFARLEQAGSPIRQSAIVKQTTAFLNAIPPDEAMQIGFGGRATKRTASLCFATFQAGQYPFACVDEVGLSILQHGVFCRRTGDTTPVADVVLAYVSWHAMARLHERNHRLTASSAFNIFAFIGVLGYITRHSAKHVGGNLSLHFGDTLVVGSLKHAIVGSGDVTGGYLVVTCRMRIGGSKREPWQPLR